jgi:peptidyl-prolyl cis-trans isomerase C
VLARVGRYVVTRHTIDSLLGTAPQSLQQQYRSSPGQYRTVVERLVDSEVMRQAAERDSVDRDPAYRAELAARARDLAVRYYYQRQLRRAPSPTDSAIAAAYEARSKEFDVPGRARVRHILFRTEAQAAAARRRLLSGSSWDSVCARESRDRLTSKTGGVIGFVSTDSDLVPGMGKQSQFAAATLALREGEISKPLRTEKGWHLVMVDERQDPSHRPLSEVRDRIRSDLQVRLNEAFADSLLDSLRSYSGAAIFDDSIAVALQPGKTPQELFEQAQASGQPVDRIALYRSLVRKYPKERVSEQAAFMIGFTYAEDLSDSSSARGAFEEFLRTYPHSDLATSARWMLDHMGEPNPPFEGEVRPDSTGSQEGK